MSFIFCFPLPIVQATFLERPQRFLARVALPDGTETLAYCANPGSLRGCLRERSRVLLWDSGNLDRKRRYTWRAIKLGNVWVGTDTHLANEIVVQLLKRGLLPTLIGYDRVEREIVVEPGLRLDFMLTGAKGICFLEVKNSVVVENGVARFPDSITTRGLKHLVGLTRKAEEGHRSVLLFIVPRSDADSFSICDHHYPAYAEALRSAIAAGVELIALSVNVSPKGFNHPRPLSCLFRNSV